VDFNGNIISQVLRYLDHYKIFSPQKLESPLEKKLDEIITSFDRNFLEDNKNILFDLAIAADFFLIQGLSDLVCAKIASIMDEYPTLFEDMIKKKSILNSKKLEINKNF
jgi:hypothetical protein